MCAFGPFVIWRENSNHKVQDFVDKMKLLYHGVLLLKTKVNFSRSSILFIWDFGVKFKYILITTLAFLGYMAVKFKSAFLRYFSNYCIADWKKKLKITLTFLWTLLINFFYRPYILFGAKIQIFWIVDHSGHVCRAWLLENRPAIKVCLVTHSKLFLWRQNWQSCSLCQDKKRSFC